MPPMCELPAPGSDERVDVYVVSLASPELIFVQLKNEEDRYCSKSILKYFTLSELWI